jgi:hypothetical protein
MSTRGCGFLGSSISKMDSSSFADVVDVRMVWLEAVDVRIDCEA